MTGRPTAIGPGVRLLASVTGRAAEPMAGDPTALGRGLLAFGAEAMSLLRGYVSDDPAVREAAERRWAELAAMLPPPAEPGGPRPSSSAGLSEADGERLRRGLSKVVATLEDAARSERAREDR